MNQYFDFELIFYDINCKLKINKRVIKTEHFRCNGDKKYLFKEVF